MAHESTIRAGNTPQGAPIPDKLYFRIGEVAQLCGVPTYVLRFWETEFPQLRPHKGGTGQRLFRRRDVEMALRIRALLYDEGYTIPGARQLLRNEPKSTEPQLPLSGEILPDQRARRLQQLHADLRDLRDLLSRPPDSSPASAAPTRRQRNLRAVDNRPEKLFDFGKIERDTAPDPEEG